MKKIYKQHQNMNSVFLCCFYKKNFQLKLENYQTIPDWIKYLLKCLCFGTLSISRICENWNLKSISFYENISTFSWQQILCELFSIHWISITSKSSWQFFDKKIMMASLFVPLGCFEIQWKRDKINIRNFLWIEYKHQFQ